MAELLLDEDQRDALLDQDGRIGVPQDMRGTSARTSDAMSTGMAYPFPRRPEGMEKPSWADLCPGGQVAPDSRILLLAVMFRVGFGRFPSMVGRMEMVSVRDVGMVRGFLVVAGLMVFCRFPMMVRGVLVVFSGLQVMFCCLF